MMIRHFIGPLALLAALGPAAAARGQDDLDLADPAAAQPARPMFQLNRQTFDQWVFGNNNASKGGRDKGEALLTIEVDELARACGLSDEQKRELTLAGRGDIERFFAEVEQKRAELQDKQYEQEKINELYQKLQPFQARYNAGLFGEHSLLEKAANRLLDADQAGRREAARRARDEFRFRAKVELAVSILNRSLGLTADQRDAFTRILQEKIRAPRRGGQYDYYVILYRASLLPEETLRPIFDDAQWKVLNKQFAQSKSLEQFLRSNGYLDDEGTDGEAKPDE